MGGALCFTRKSEDLLPPLPILQRGPLLVEDSRWGVCWRVGFPCGLFPPVWCFPPRCLGAAPLRFFCRAWLLPFCDVCSLLSSLPSRRLADRPDADIYEMYLCAACSCCTAFAFCLIRLTSVSVYIYGWEVEVAYAQRATRNTRAACKRNTYQPTTTTLI